MHPTSEQSRDESTAERVRAFHRAFGLDCRRVPGYGTAAVHGIDLDAVIAEVHRANMSKLGPDGRPVLRADGKVLKGDCYTPPDVAAVLRAQGWSPPPARP